jgi:hypothetical protein
MLSGLLGDVHEKGRAWADRERVKEGT